MSTYEEFMVIIAVAALIVSILKKNKQTALLSGKEWAVYLKKLLNIFRRGG